MKYIVIVLSLLLVHTSYAQDSLATPAKKKLQGTFYLGWGYHKDFYTNSNIHFKDTETDNYDFTIYNAKAHDRVDGHCLFQQPLTVPQYVFYGGYYFNNKGDWGVEAGWDHLKYIVTDNQALLLSGEIRGTSLDQDTLINYNFIHYEHTNGNNYMTVSVVKRHNLFTSKNEYHKLGVVAKLGVGGLVPKTQSVIMGNQNDGPFRLAGYVFTLAGSIRYDVYRYFFLEATTKGAFAHYTDDKLYMEGRAKQSFFSVQFIIAAGVNIPLSKK
ncbi:MAG: hypothetical protein H7259_01315 [Cytophagales bacterium]|nr:hypothetical protein [Cytophaga sp.]